MDQEKGKLVFRKYSDAWWQVCRGENVIAGLSALCNGKWLIVDLNEKQLSCHYTLNGAKVAARKLFA